MTQMIGWCPGWESNPHEEKSPEDFKSSASAIPPPGHRQKNKISMHGEHAQIKSEDGRGVECRYARHIHRDRSQVSVKPRSLASLGMTGFGGCRLKAEKGDRRTE